MSSYANDANGNGNGANPNGNASAPTTNGTANGAPPNPLLQNPPGSAMNSKRRGSVEDHRGYYEEKEINPPWFMKDHAAEYDEKSITWQKIRSIRGDDVVSTVSSWLSYIRQETRPRVTMGYHWYLNGYSSLDFWVPMARWIRTYDWKRVLWNDFVAALAITSMVVPQGMSYASSIALLPKEFGLYTAFTPCLIYGVFGTSRQLAVGPVAVVATLMASELTKIMPPLWREDSFGWKGKYNSKKKMITTKPWIPIPNPSSYDAVRCAPLYEDLNKITPEMLLLPAYKGCSYEAYNRIQTLYNTYAIQTAFLVGLLQLLLGLLRLGFITNFLSHSVISGFTTGAAFIIGLGQVGDLWGYKLLKKDYVHQSLHSIFYNIKDDWQWRDFLMSCIWLMMLSTFKRLGKMKRKGFIAFRAIGPLTVMVLGIVVTAIGDAANGGSDKWRISEGKGYNTIGKVPKGVPPVTYNRLSISALSVLWKAVLAVASVDLMESIALGKAMARKNGYRINSNDEYRALGVMNTICAGFSIMPATGSFSRTSVNDSCGARSPLACFFVGVLMVFVLEVVTPIFRYIPKNTIAAIIISGVLGLLRFDDAAFLWRASKKDFFIWMACWVCTMFLGVDLGLGISVGLAILIVIYESAFPNVTRIGRIPGTSIYRNIRQYPDAKAPEGVLCIRLDSPLYFFNTQYIRDRIDELVDEYTGARQIYLAMIRAGDTPAGGNGNANGNANGNVSTVSNISKKSPSKGNLDEESGVAGTGSVVSNAAALQLKAPPRYIALDFSPVTRADSTSIHMLEELLEDLHKKNCQLVIVNPSQYVLEIFDMSGYMKKLGRENVFVTMADAVSHCTTRLSQGSQ